MTELEREEQGLKKLHEIAGGRASSPLGDWNQYAPDMRNYIVRFIAGDILSRPGLDTRTRQLATVAMLAAKNDAPDEFRMHLGGALNVGWTREQLVEVLLQSAVFAGFPAALNALKLAGEVFDQHAAGVSARDLIAKAQAADAALDVDAFVALLDPAVVMRIGNGPELHGREAVHEGIGGLFATMERIEHRTIQITEDQGKVFLQAEATMTPKGGSPMTLPYVNALRIGPSGLFTEYRIYISL